MSRSFCLALIALAGLAGPASAGMLTEFRFTANAAISGHNTEHLNEVTPEQCAAACRSSANSQWCRSFDYQRAARQCDLSDKRASDVGGPKTDYPGNPYDHYNLSPDVNRPNPVPGERRLLVIGIDGLRGDSLTCPNCARPPAILSLIDSGAFHAKVLAGGSQSTFSGRGWATQFTGFWADRHGVSSNDINLPLTAPHVFSLIKQAYPGATTAVVADWPNLTQNLLPPDADFVVRNDGKASQQASDAVKDWLAWRNPPTAIFYYLHNVDIHTCCWEPDNAFYKQKILDEDAQIQQVLDALVRRPTYQQENWLIVLMSDHGGKGTGHGGQSTAERVTPLVMTNSYRAPERTPYCVGDFTDVTLRQVGGLTPHALDFFGIPNRTKGDKLPACGAASASAAAGN